MVDLGCYWIALKSKLGKLRSSIYRFIFVYELFWAYEFLSDRMDRGNSLSDKQKEIYKEVSKHISFLERNLPLCISGDEYSVTEDEVSEVSAFRYGIDKDYMGYKTIFNPFYCKIMITFLLNFVLLFIFTLQLNVNFSYESGTYASFVRSIYVIICVLSVVWLSVDFIYYTLPMFRELFSITASKSVKIACTAVDGNIFSREIVVPEPLDFVNRNIKWAKEIGRKDLELELDDKIRFSADWFKVLVRMEIEYMRYKDKYAK